MSDFRRRGWNTFDSLSYDPDLGPSMGWDPVALVNATKRISLNSQRFIERFEALDTAPVQVVDTTTQAQRDVQIIRMTRSICGLTARQATDAQVLSLYRTFMKGWM